MFVRRGFCLIALSLLSLVHDLNAFALSADLPWYLQAPKGRTTAAAIDAAESIAASPREPTVVAVIDNGIWVDHPSLSGVLLPGWDMVSPERNPRKQRSRNVTPDLVGVVCPLTEQSGETLDPFHGTEIASVIAGNGKLGVTGVNPHVLILPVKAVGACKASRRDLMDAIAWAAGLPVKNAPPNDHPARVINISMAGRDKTCHVELQQLIDKVVEKGVVIVAAAGNTFGRPATEPAICQGVVGVGAVNPDGTRAFYSALDDRIYLLAPGGGKELSAAESEIKNRIRVATFKLVPSLETASDTPNMIPVGVDIGIGTSYATPLATGAVAALLSKNPNWTVQDVLKQIEAKLSAQPGGTSKYLNYHRLAH